MYPPDLHRDPENLRPQHKPGDCRRRHGLGTKAVPVRYLEGDLSQEDELVALEEPARRVHVHRVSDLVRQVYHALLHLVGGRCLLDGFLKHHVEGLGEASANVGILQMQIQLQPPPPVSFWLNSDWGAGSKVGQRDPLSQHQGGGGALAHHPLAPAFSCAP